MDLPCYPGLGGTDGATLALEGLLVLFPGCQRGRARAPGVPAWGWLVLYSRSRATLFFLVVLMVASFLVKVVLLLVAVPLLLVVAS